MSNPTVTINGNEVTLIPTGKISGGGKTVSKFELRLPNGDMVIVTAYTSGASDPKAIPAQLERARQENAKLKAAAKNSTPVIFDTGTRKVVASSADGGMADLREQVATMARMLGSLSAKLA